MKKHVLEALSFAAIATLALSQPVKADPMDPAFVETLTNSCMANCASVALANDPDNPGGPKTVEFTFNSTIPSVVAGDVLIDEFGTTTVGDVIRFENIGTTAVAFIYSNDISTGLAADVGLPASFLSPNVTFTENSAGFAGPYTPSAGQPGYCATCASAPIYGLTSLDAVPAPLIGRGLPLALVVGAMLFGAKLLERGEKRRQLEATA